MDFYRTNLAVLTIVNACLLFQQHRGRHSKPEPQQLLHDGKTQLAARASIFQYRVLPVYALAVAADWLQGPQTYAIYKYEKHIPEDHVAFLYAVGFVSGGTSAYFVGQLADRFGRKRMCLAYCACYGLTCWSMLSDSFVVLCLGRASGGCATTILYSAFETWIISEHHARELDEGDLPLSDIFGSMATTSGIVAICSGILGDGLVQRFGSRIWPFYASLLCCIGTAILMLLLWRENYGAKDATAGSVGRAPHRILCNSRVLLLGFAMLAFEGTMYLFVFFWSAALKSTRAKYAMQGDVPYGLVFSSFMCAMMIGSGTLSVGAARISSSGSAQTVLSLAFSLTVACLAVVTLFDREYAMFYAFCIIEGCVGAYFPSMALIKSGVIEDGMRGRVYSLLRLPLNCFVVVVHAFDQEGDEHRNGVFLLCAFLLILANWCLQDVRLDRRISG